MEGQYCEAISVLAGCVVLAFQFLFNSNTCYEDDTVSHVILVWRVRVAKLGWPHRAGTTHAVQSMAPFLTYHQFLRILRWPSGDSAITLHCLLRFIPVLPPLHAQGCATHSGLTLSGAAHPANSACLTSTIPWFPIMQMQHNSQSHSLLGEPLGGLQTVTLRNDLWTHLCICLSPPPWMSSVWIPRNASTKSDRSY